jgi:hypothetical protein
MTHDADESLFRHDTQLLPALCGFLATGTRISNADRHF